MNGEISAQTLTTLACSFFNSYVYSEAKLNVEYIKLYIDSSKGQGTQTASLILNLIQSRPLCDLTDPIVTMELETSGKTEAEVNKFMGMIKEMRNYSKQQVEPFLDILRRTCGHGYLEYARRKSNGNPVEYIKLTQQYNYQANQSDNLVVKDFSKLDAQALKEQYSAVGYRSRYDFINNTFSVGGYIPGQIVQVVGAPSCFIGSTTIITRSKVNGSISTHSFEELANSYKNYQVLSYNVKTHGWEWSGIKWLSVTKQVSELCCNQFDGDYTVYSTYDHNFLINNDPELGRAWVSAEDLQVRMSFQSIHPNVKLITKPKLVDYKDQSIDVWDLETESENHNFCLGNGVVVHNCGKSLFMQGEAVNFVEQGKRVHYLTLGDQIKVA